MTPEALADLVRAAFAGAPRPAPEAIVPHPCEECIDLRDHMAGSTWDDLGIGFLRTYVWDLPLLSGQAKRYYLPVWLLASIGDPGADATPALLFALDSDHRWEPEGGYSAAQREAIVEYLRFMLDHAHDSDMPNLDRALRRWDPEWT